MQIIRWKHPNVTKPIILIDQDGPLADFDRHFFQRCQEKGITLDCEFEQQNCRYASDHIPDAKEREEAKKMVYNTHWFLELPVTPGAKEGLEELNEKADIWIVTKPLEKNRWCRDDKAIWVEKNLGEKWVRRLILAPDKSLVRGNILLDDAPILDWLHEHTTWCPVLYRTGYNGMESKWGGLPQWDWSESIESLLDYG